MIRTLQFHAALILFCISVCYFYIPGFQHEMCHTNKVSNYYNKENTGTRPLPAAASYRPPAGTLLQGNLTLYSHCVVDES